LDELGAGTVELGIADVEGIAVEGIADVEGIAVEGIADVEGVAVEGIADVEGVAEGVIEADGVTEGAMDDVNAAVLLGIVLVALGRISTKCGEGTARNGCT
jgi:hypothetical protein